MAIILIASYSLHHILIASYSLHHTHCIVGKLSGTWAATGRSPLTLTVDAIILEVNRGSPPYVGTLRRMQVHLLT